jgi:hypothetical protein
MMPPKKEYEKVKMDEFVSGTIESYQYDEKHEFTGPKGIVVKPAIKFSFIIDGMEYPKTSKWMSFSYHEKSTLFIKYISVLVKDAKPGMAFDVDQLVGLKVKMLWKEDKNPLYQVLDSIRPIGEKVIAIDNFDSAKKTDVQKKLDVPF